MPQTRYQFVAGAFGDEPARIDNPDPRAQTLRFLHVVGGVKNRGARVAQALDQIENRAAALRVDADCRLIEDQQLGSMQNSAREIQASLHPARICADDVVGARRETHRIERAFDRIMQRVAAQIVHPPPEVEIFARGEIQVKSDRLRHDPDKGARGQDPASISMPSMVISPASRARIPAIIEIEVVLPAPLGPSRP